MSGDFCTGGCSILAPLGPSATFYSVNHDLLI